MSGRSRVPVLVLHLAVIAALFALQGVLGDYGVLTLTRIMLLAVFACGFNLLFGYTGLLSLGHALFFAAGLYGAGLTAYHLGFAVPAAFLAGLVAAAVAALAVGVLALRTIRVSFMIVTLMFAQAFHLLTLYAMDVTRGDEGLTLPAAARSFALFGWTVDLADPRVRYNLAAGLLAVTLVLVLRLVTGPAGRTLVAIRENEERAEMLGTDVFRAKLAAFVLSGTISGAAGAAYALLFAYVGATFASIQYSIEALLFTLLGGAGTVLGPVLGTMVMVLLIDRLSELTAAWLLVVGVVLIALVLWFPRGLLGTLRDRWLPWLP